MHKDVLLQAEKRLRAVESAIEAAAEQHREGGSLLRLLGVGIDAFPYFEELRAGELDSLGWTADPSGKGFDYCGITIEVGGHVQHDHRPREVLAWQLYGQETLFALVRQEREKSERQRLDWYAMPHGRWFGLMQYLTHLNSGACIGSTRDLRFGRPVLSVAGTDVYPGLIPLAEHVHLVALQTLIDCDLALAPDPRKVGDSRTLTYDRARVVVERKFAGAPQRVTGVDLAMGPEQTAKVMLEPPIVRFERAKVIAEEVLGRFAPGVCTRVYDVCASGPGEAFVIDVTWRLGGAPIETRAVHTFDTLFANGGERARIITVAEQLERDAAAVFFNRAAGKVVQ